MPPFWTRADSGGKDPFPETGREPQADTAVGTQVSGDGNQLEGNAFALQNLFRLQRMADRDEQNDEKSLPRRHGLILFPASSRIASSALPTCSSVLKKPKLNRIVPAG